MKGPVTPAPSPADTLRVEELRVVSEMPVPAGSPWDEWDRLTRFLESARIAFARERDYWASTRIEGAAQGRISAPEGHYKVSPRRHIDAINDAETLHGSVLVHSYALAESAAAEKLEDPRSFGGIEDWGARLLDANGRDWNDVKDGLAGAVEVAVTRNAFAHGSRTIDALARGRDPSHGHRLRSRLEGAVSTRAPVRSPRRVSRRPGPRRSRPRDPATRGAPTP